MKSFYKALKDLDIAYSKTATSLNALFVNENKNKYFGLKNKFKIIFSSAVLDNSGKDIGELVFKYTLYGTGDNSGIIDKYAIASPKINEDDLPGIHYMKTGVFLYPGRSDVYRKSKGTYRVSASIDFSGSDINLEQEKKLDFYSPTSNKSPLDILYFLKEAHNKFESFENNISFDKNLVGLDSVKVTDKSTIKADTLRIKSAENNFTVFGPMLIQGSSTGQSDDAYERAGTEETNWRITRFTEGETYYYQDGPFYNEYDPENDGAFSPESKYYGLEGNSYYEMASYKTAENAYLGGFTVYTRHPYYYRKAVAYQPELADKYYVRKKNSTNIHLENKNIIFEDYLSIGDPLYGEELNNVLITFKNGNNIKLYSKNTSEFGDESRKSLTVADVSDANTVFPNNIHIVYNNDATYIDTGYLRVPLDIEISEIRDLFGRPRLKDTKDKHYIPVPVGTKTPTPGVQYYLANTSVNTATGETTTEYVLIVDPIVEFAEGTTYYYLDDDGFGINPLSPEYSTFESQRTLHFNPSPTYIDYNTITDVLVGTEGLTSIYNNRYKTFRNYAKGFDITAKKIYFNPSRDNALTYGFYVYDSGGYAGGLKCRHEKDARGNTAVIGGNTPRDNTPLYCYLPMSVNKGNADSVSIYFKDDLNEIKGHCMGFIPNGSEMDVTETDACFIKVNLSNYDRSRHYYINEDDTYTEVKITEFSDEDTREFFTKDDINSNDYYAVVKMNNKPGEIFYTRRLTAATVYSPLYRYADANGNEIIISDKEEFARKKNQLYKIDFDKVADHSALNLTDDFYIQSNIIIKYRGELHKMTARNGITHDDKDRLYKLYVNNLSQIDRVDINTVESQYI